MNLQKLFLIFFITLFGCSNNHQDGGELCVYEKFLAKAEIVNLKFENDSITEVQFVFENESYVTLNHWDFSGRVEFEFDQELLKEKKSGYLISGNRITNGTCQPYHIEKVSLENAEQETKGLHEGSALIEDIDPCDFVYDTITDSKYNIHLNILEKFYDEKKRGYIFSSEGDTLNHFLYDQDIASFVGNLTPNETGVYRLLTNKTVFLILSHDASRLDHGLNTWSQNEMQLDYFLEHVSSPLCHSLAIDDIIQYIEAEMPEHKERSKQLKELILSKLIEAKM